MSTWRAIAQALDSAPMQRAFRGPAPLPRGFGIGLNERVVEYGWLFSRRPAGCVLDAGSSLNHRRLLERLVPTLDSLHIVTLAPEREAHTALGVSYVYADLRQLPYADETFDDVICVSTLEHVGMDNTMYAAADEPAPDAQAETQRALTELLRVARPGGRVLVTVPYGVPKSMGWSRVIARNELERLCAMGASVSVDVFAYSPVGWQFADLDSAAQAVYREQAVEPAPADLAANARAVACLSISR